MRVRRVAGTEEGATTRGEATTVREAVMRVILRGVEEVWEVGRARMRRSVGEEEEVEAVDGGGRAYGTAGQGQQAFFDPIELVTHGLDLGRCDLGRRRDLCLLPRRLVDRLLRRGSLGPPLLGRHRRFDVDCLRTSGASGEGARSSRGARAGVATVAERTVLRFITARKEAMGSTLRTRLAGGGEGCSKEHTSVV